MGGGIIQLAANGVRDVCLVGNPQITFFKLIYRRHTNFSIESIEQKIVGTPGFGHKVSCHISRSGDLIHRIYVEIKLQNASWMKGTYRGLALIKSIEIEIGGQQIDKHYGDWMYIWNELSLPVGKLKGYRSMVGYDDVGLDPDWSVPLTSSIGESISLYVPIEFWFCRNVGLALPLIAIQYHPVVLNIEFDSSLNANIDTERYQQHITGTTIFEDASIWVDYIFLDLDERSRLAKGSHEYLIEQLQFSGEETITSELTKVNLRFNHPVKEIVWVSQKYSARFGVYHGDDGNNLTKEGSLLLNATNRFAKRSGPYFNLVQPYQHHRNVPVSKGINVYSFSLFPEEYQPSGSLNFSRIDSAELWVTSVPDASKIRVYAVNYNILRVMAGMSGATFSN